MKVSNMTSYNGNTVPNQFIIENDRLVKGRFTRYFQSYDSIIAAITSNGTLYLDKTYWDYSRTTSKYRNQFTGLDTKQTKQGIKDGSIKLVDLN